ncbi:2'-deoxynucleoside 5'-phosphate N-hydrolase 1 [Quaeritorhiza haematococci]|nr:2'-deoxynucleoside 5'-phosphate N-hydrolase 1 [Quaeritorhiza haematococci]
MNWLSSADVVIAECTQPSLGVGYEIGIAEKLGKKICVLYRGPKEARKLSAMLSGNPHVTVVYYSDVEEACRQIDGYLTKNGFSIST